LKPSTILVVGVLWGDTTNAESTTRLDDPDKNHADRATGEEIRRGWNTTFLQYLTMSSTSFHNCGNWFEATNSRNVEIPCIGFPFFLEPEFKLYDVTCFGCLIIYQRNT
jgi:hypothetical protein